MKILIVDDDKSVTEYMQMELEDCCKDMDIGTCNSGYEALSLIMHGDISLLITDIAMPDMDGYELYSRAKEYNDKLPIIMMTGFGYDPNHAVVKSRKDGLQDVIFKPFDTQKLFALIKKRLAGE
jgi:two-component system, sensor histidine kinase SagS